MMAPSSLFQLENYDDPLMFASLGNDYFYLIHKWGNDLSFFRKIMMWPFKSLYNIIIFMCFISLFLTLIIPKDLFQYENNPGAEFFITYLFVFIRSVRQVEGICIPFFTEDSNRKCFCAMVAFCLEPSQSRARQRRSFNFRSTSLANVEGGLL